MKLVLLLNSAGMMEEILKKTVERYEILLMKHADVLPIWCSCHKKKQGSFKAPHSS